MVLKKRILTITTEMSCFIKKDTKSLLGIYDNQQNNVLNVDICHFQFCFSSERKTIFA